MSNDNPRIIDIAGGIVIATVAACSVIWYGFDHYLEKGKASIIGDCELNLSDISNNLSLKPEDDPESKYFKGIESVCRGDLTFWQFRNNGNIRVALYGAGLIGTADLHLIDNDKARHAVAIWIEHFSPEADRDKYYRPLAKITNFHGKWQ